MTTPTQNYRQTRALLAQHPDLVGIYNIGGASDGIGARAASEADRGQKVAFVGHGLTPDTRALLLDGTMDVGDHAGPRRSMVLNCVRIFTNLRDGRAAMAGIEPMQISLFVRENLRVIVSRRLAGIERRHGAGIELAAAARDQQAIERERLRGHRHGDVLLGGRGLQHFEILQHLARIAARREVALGHAGKRDRQQVRAGVPRRQRLRDFRVSTP